MARKRNRTDRLDIGKPFATDRPQAGDMREVSTPPPEQDQVDRALVRSYEADQNSRQEYNEARPQSGEIREAKSEESDEEVQREQDRKFLNLARERFRIAAEATARLRSEALDDLKFRIGEQWPNEIERQRSIDGRPCLTMNRLPQFIRQVTNEQRQQRPAIQINPVGSGATVDTAETLQGMCRHIEVNSEADIAYDSAFDGMVTKGFDFWRIVTDYARPDSFDQEIYIRRVRNPFAVYFDPAAIEPDYSDARYAFVIEDMPRSEYRARYGNTEAATLSDFSSVGDNAAEWATKETIRIAEYFYVQEDDYQLCLLTTGETVKSTEIPEGAIVQNRRPATERQVMWAKINALEIIEKTKWPGKYIPIIPVLGDDLDVNGQRHLAGMVRNAKDPQRMYNYWISAGTEMIALAPRAPFVGAEGQFEGHEKEWADANVRNFAKLEYKPTTIAGQPAPPPQRQIYEPPVQSINMMTRQADADLKAVMGIYDPTLGSSKQEQSGKAINLLQKQGDISNYNWVDNLSRAIRHTGRVLIDLIPKIYDAPRVQRIIKPDNSTSHVVVHNGQPDQAQDLTSENVQGIFDLSVGEYDVTVSVGPSYQTKRQEAVAGQIALVQAYPEVFGVIGDMLVANMDWPQAKEMSKRLRKTLPPNLQDDGDPGDPQQKIAQLQAQLNAVMQQHEQLTQVVNQQNEVIQTKQVEQQGKMSIEKLKVDAQVLIAEINAKVQESQLRMKMEQDMWKELHGSAHEVAMQNDEQAHEKELAQIDAQATKAAAKAKPANGSAQ